MAQLSEGALVRVRQRRWLVEGVTPPPERGDATLVELSCADDDAQGQPLTVLWEHELDAEVLKAEDWGRVGEKGFDPPDLFAAYLHTLRWNTVTSTDPTLFQAPFRAGIRIDAYQLEPLRKALALPRVNMFIADDVGLGKTIEAGLIARELLLRRRVDVIVVAVPPSMLTQWQDELEARFGLTFVILDRAYIAEVRRERGYAVNPWTTHSRFLVSHRLLIDEAYVAGLRDWLGEFRARSLLILDEAHHAAPSSGARYAIDSQITRAMRDVAPRFEHRLFLSATPHNGHSNSFSALLEILDSQRFVRGVKVRKGDLDAIMVRRLKDDIRELEGGFPKRIVEQVDIADLPPDAPELALAEKLDAYRTLRDARLAASSPAVQRRGRLATTTLQQRLLSSIEAFVRTLKVHKRGVEQAVADAKDEAPAPIAPAAMLNLQPVGADDDRATLEPEDLQKLDDDAVAAATRAGLAGASKESLRRELALIEEMEALAERHRDAPDARIVKILEWIEAHMCPGALSPDREHKKPPRWNSTRLLVFTEWEATRIYLERRLKAALAHTDQAEERIGVFTGSTSADRREALKRAFNADPESNPLRILIATDAAREGLNFQRHCRDLYHFDLPWNPSRLEQRNGRIDRKLQPAKEVHCRYFFYTQRPEDRVLQVLVQKSERIRKELGSMAQLLEGRVASLLAGGIQRSGLDRQIKELETDSDRERVDAIKDELEEARERQSALKEQIERVRRMVERAERHIGFEAAQLRSALSVSLGLARATPIEEAAAATAERPALFQFPAEDPSLTADASWSPAIDLLREPRERGEKLWEWRKRARTRPVSFEDTGELGDAAVHLHLEHRLVQRLLARFTSQGLVHFDLSRACLATAKGGEARIILLGRLALYGPQAARLHEELIPVTARWIDPELRKGGLKPYATQAEERTLELLEEALAAPSRRLPSEVQKRLAGAIGQDVSDLLKHLEERGREVRGKAEERLRKRGEVESAEMRRLIEDQRKRILTAARQYDDRQQKLEFNEEERRRSTEERRQREADRRAWSRRLEHIDGELEREPRRIGHAYSVRAVRLEPIGLVYLWPVTG